MATIPISQLPPAPNGTGSGSSKGTDLFPATDTTDTSSAPSGTTKKYTLSEINNFILHSQGLTTYDAVRVASTTAFVVTYANGASGVGATLTNATTQAVLSIDGVTMVLGDRVLVKNQVSTFQNGIYTVTNIGSGATNWVMTRATDYDQASEIVQYGVVLVNQGTISAGLLYQETGAGPWTIGTTPIVFALYAVSFGSGSVSSITGTANQVLANGTTASAQTGAVTLTLPQSIATSSTPVFAGATLGDLNFSGSTIITTGVNESLFINPNGTGRTVFDTATEFATSVSIQVASVSANADLALGTFSATQSNASVYYMYKSHSAVVGSFSAVSNGDIAGLITARGDDGTTFQNVASIAFNVSGSVSSGIVPGQITMSTVNAAGALTQAMAISNAQVVSLTNALLPASGGLGTAVAPSAGQIPIGTSGGVYTAAAINSGSGIVVANGSGSITISATGGGVAWVSIAGTTQAAAVNTGYIVANASQTTITLPATAAIGDTIKVRGLGAAGWILAANTGQTIKYITATTSSGGSLTSAEQYDNIEVTCIVANTTWTVAYAATTGLTVA